MNQVTFYRNRKCIAGSQEPLPVTNQVDKIKSIVLWRLCINITITILNIVHDVSETELCVRLQVKSTQVGPIDRASLWLQAHKLFRLGPPDLVSLEDGDRLQSPKRHVLNTKQTMNSVHNCDNDTNKNILRTPIVLILTWKLGNRLHQGDQSTQFTSQFPTQNLYASLVANISATCPAASSVASITLKYVK
jgi:hypothetical protein